MFFDLTKILSDQPKYRLKQIEKALFDVKINSFSEITTLPKDLQNKLKDFPWMSLELHTISKSQIDSTEKALLKLVDGNLIETVLMGRENTKETREGEERHTICISTQVGCPMKCVFCATGKTGFKRNLTAEEIIDQFRFWQKRVSEPISNIVVMGQGEPFLNYDNLKIALNSILENTEIGPTKITVSTCGVPNGMEKILSDRNFPQVRFALSLHSAIEETREKIMPSHQKGFLQFLVKWAEKYHQFIPSRTHYIGLEYLMLSGISDDQKHLEALKKLANKIPRVRINLISYNDNFENRKQEIKNKLKLISSSRETIEYWHNYLMESGFICTIRRSQGQDISAACGQLCNKIKK